MRRQHDVFQREARRDVRLVVEHVQRRPGDIASFERAAISAGSSTTAPRATFTRKPSGPERGENLASTRSRVAGVRGHVTTSSRLARHRSRDRRNRGSRRRPSCAGRDSRRVRSNAAARWAIARPICPRPTMPRSCRAPRGRNRTRRPAIAPARTKRSASHMPAHHRDDHAHRQVGDRLGGRVRSVGDGDVALFRRRHVDQLGRAARSTRGARAWAALRSRRG